MERSVKNKGETTGKINEISIFRTSKPGNYLCICLRLSTCGKVRENKDYILHVYLQQQHLVQASEIFQLVYEPFGVIFYPLPVSSLRAEESLLYVVYIYSIDSNILVREGVTDHTDLWDRKLNEPRTMSSNKKARRNQQSRA